MNSSLAISSVRSTYLCHIFMRRYAVKTSSAAIAGLGGRKSKDKQAAASVKIKLAVEKDPHKLVNYLCGSNLMQTGEDIKLRPDDEYPEWLWNVHTGPAKRLQELEPGSKEYLELLKKINVMKAVKLANLSKIKQQ